MRVTGPTSTVLTDTITHRCRSEIEAERSPTVLTVSLSPRFEMESVPTTIGAWARDRVDEVLSGRAKVKGLFRPSRRDFVDWSIGLREQRSYRWSQRPRTSCMRPSLGDSGKIADPPGEVSASGSNHEGALVRIPLKTGDLGA